MVNNSFDASKFLLQSHGNGFFSVIEKIERRPDFDIVEEDGDDFTYRKRKRKQRKMKPYYLKFMVRDDKISVIKGNLILTNDEIRQVYKRGF